MNVVLASVLKPVDDSRVYQKIGQSIAKIPNTNIQILGTENDGTPSCLPNITFVPLFSNHKKEAFFRIKGNKRFFSFLKSQKNIDLIIIHTIELLPALVFYKKLNPKVKIIYDMLENYPLNFKSQIYRSAWKSKVLSFLSHQIEVFSFQYLDHIFSAETTYLKEKQLPLYKTTVLENKYAGKLFNTIPSTDYLHFVICGSLTRVFGINEAINFIELLNSCKNQPTTIKFTVIGKAYESDIIEKLKKINQFHNVECIGITNFIPHSKIIKEMLTASYLLLSYPKNPCTKNCIPTKMYEGLALGIPMIIQNNSLWEEITTPTNSSIFIDFNKKSDILSIFDKIQTHKPYRKGPDKNALWKSEEEKLLNVIQTL
ncbi:hypothetical protein [Flammeovirga sp. SubArs3]|uniref:hypothetical protein n=1 Tax=Flammeovirga sp. SubArs3 TaxID=2995316 RepID=UPI00248B022F|nr:hypothetical protein [Flammeovirga sp. SubArs3]